MISQSFAATEQSFHSAADVQVAKFDKIYQEAVASRITILGATGDTGTANPDKQGRAFPEPTVNWPSSDPLVTAAGGTWLQYGWKWDPKDHGQRFLCVSSTAVDPTTCYGQYLSYDNNPGVTTEAVWQEDWAAAATGGGRSVLLRRRASNRGSPPACSRVRAASADISWNASINGGVLTYLGFLGGTNNGYYIIGGTSAATPQLAGVVALANQVRQQNSKQPVGYLNPVLYQLPAGAFNDTVPLTFGNRCRGHDSGQQPGIRQRDTRDANDERMGPHHWMGQSERPGVRGGIGGGSLRTVHPPSAFRRES